MATPAKFSELGPSRKALIRMMQGVNYGAILNVQIVDGNVSFDDEVETLVDIRLDEEVKARTELQLDDFTLPTEACRLMATLDALQNGTIERIIVHAGVPRRVTLRSPGPTAKVNRLAVT